MGEEEKAPVAEGAEEKKSLFSKKNLLILLILVVILLIVSIFIVFKVIKPLVVGDATQQIDVESIGKKGTGIIFSLDSDFIVNVAGTGATRYLRVAIAFEVEDAATESEIKDRTTQLRDMIILTLGTKKMEQLDSVAARDELKRELLNKVNDLLKSGNVVNIFFTDFVIQ
ncbi:MAG: flagellar basal body-associated FliL family protein [Candidatus Aureabacteria bacterium]|nr:flagellar basal body-associated FliL family protein [Candidatus Auribacterota bacterium]